MCLGAMLEGLKAVNGGTKRKRIIPAIGIPPTISLPPVPSMALGPGIGPIGGHVMQPPASAAPPTYNRKDGRNSSGSRIKSPEGPRSHFEEGDKPEILAVCVECRERKKSKRYCREVSSHTLLFTTPCILHTVCYRS